MVLRRELKETALSAPGAANGRTSQGFTNSIEFLQKFVSFQPAIHIFIKAWGVLKTDFEIERI